MFHFVGVVAFLIASLFFRFPQSISQPVAVPTHCTASTECKIIMLPNTTAILIAKESGSGTIIDSLGGAWIRDECTPFDNGECIFHAQLNAPYPIGDVLTFPAGGYPDVYILQYEGLWNFVVGEYGTYNDQNSVFPDCTNGQNCPYDWTLPVEADAGNLLVAYSFPNSSGPGIPKPGLGYNIEASDGFLAIEDMIAPIEGVYIGSLIWKNSDGSSGGGSHWLMGIGVYARAR